MNETHKPESFDAYRLWRRHANFGAVSDIDQVEWRDGKPVAVIELTIYEPTKEYALPRPGYFASIEKTKFEGKSKVQTEIVLHVAKALDVPAYLVLWHEEMTHFWRFALKNRVWDTVPLSLEQYEAWVRGLGKPKAERGQCKPKVAWG